MTQPPASRFERERRAVRLRMCGCWASAVLLGAALAVVLPRKTASAEPVSQCERMPIVEGPEGWRGWEVEPDLAGYQIDGKQDCDPVYRPCALYSTHLLNGDTCPGDGPSLDAWFAEGGSAPDWTKTRRDIAVHSSNGIFVAAAHYGPGDPHTPEQFVVAFRPRKVARPTGLLALGSKVVVPLLLLGGLCALLGTMLRAGRRSSRAAAYQDAKRYRSGWREPSGSVLLDDGGPPVLAPGDPGPVLLRIEVSVGDVYRVARARVLETVKGDRDTASSVELDRARVSLSMACILSTLGAVAVALILYEDVIRAFQRAVGE